jgi:TfoX/Sxy family transcriptional regulator of competence genes
MAHEPKTLQGHIEAALGPMLAHQEVTFKPMFGGITGYTRGRNFASLSNVGLALKLSKPDMAALLLLPGARPLQYEPNAPVSKQSVVVPDTMLADAADLSAWLERSMAHCQTLPLPKKKTKTSA